MGGGPGFIRQGPDESRLLEKQRYGARGGNPDYGGSLRLSRSALSTEEGNIAEPNSNIIDLDTKRQEPRTGPMLYLRSPHARPLRSLFSTNVQGG